MQIVKIIGTILMLMDTSISTSGLQVGTHYFRMIFHSQKSDLQASIYVVEMV